MLVLIIGLGSIAKKHIIALNNLDLNIEIIALRTVNFENSTKGIKNIKSLNELTSNPDFAIISNPTSYHKTTIEKLLDHQIPMFVEKPAFHTLKDVDELVNSINNSNLINYVAFNLRFHPCIEYLKCELKNVNKVINEVNVYCGSYLPEWRNIKNFRKNYSCISSLGGGVHLDLIHEIDYIVWLLGIPKSSHIFKSNKSSLKIDSVDYANYLLEYDNFNISIILNYYRRDPKRCIEIIFEDETWTIDLLKSFIKNSKEDIIFKNDDFLIQETYNKQMKYFIDKLNNKVMPMNTLQESLYALKIVLQNG